MQMGGEVVGYHPPLDDLADMTACELMIKQTCHAATVDELIAVEQGGLAPFHLMDIADDTLRQEFACLQIALARYDASPEAKAVIHEIIRNLEDRELDVDRTVGVDKYVTTTARALWSSKQMGNSTI